MNGPHRRMSLRVCNDTTPNQPLERTAADGVFAIQN
jgi:hypothetical protein